jgi:hypothetical protein
MQGICDKNEGSDNKIQRKKKKGRGIIENS